MDKIQFESEKEAYKHYLHVIDNPRIDWHSLAKEMAKSAVSLRLLVVLIDMYICSKKNLSD